MARFSVRCPTCRKKFILPDATVPNECPNPDCNSRIGIEHDDTVVVMPSIRSARMAAIDTVYRDMEKGSEIRAQAAAEMTGSSVAEMSALKITDLRPTTHHGDVAAPALPAHLRNVGGFQGAGAEYGGAINTGAVTVNGQVFQGVEPNAGARARTGLQNFHANLTRGAGVSDRPALETQAPGYRIRG